MALNRGAPTPRRPPTKSYRGWKGLNLANSRLTLEDDELAWGENVMPVGKELQSLPLYNGDPGPIIHSVSPKTSLGVYLKYGAFDAPHPCAIIVYDDGAAWMRDFFNDTITDVQIGPPGTFGSGRTAIRIWRDSPILFLDDTTGYSKWDGTAYTVIDADIKGSSLAVFDGHVWLVTEPRTILFTAPDSYDNFDTGDGAGAFRITDDAFEGQIWSLHSTVQQLWILGATSIDALGGVQFNVDDSTTTFSVTNAVSSVGSTYFDSAIGSYFRLLTFPTPASIYGLLGVTPQPLSQAIDRLFARLSQIIPHGPSVGTVQLNGRTVLAYLYAYADPVADVVRSLLLCFDSGRWFLASPPTIGGERIVDMCSLAIHGSPELYGIDTVGHCHRIFARPGDAKAGTTRLDFKLDDFGGPVTPHEAILLQLDLAAPVDVATTGLSVFLVSERGQKNVNMETIAFPAAVDSPLGLRYVLQRKGVTQGFSGDRIGVSLSLPAADRLTVAAYHVQLDPGEEWA